MIVKTNSLTLMRPSARKALSDCLIFSSNAATRAGQERTKSLVGSLPCRNLLHYRMRITLIMS